MDFSQILESIPEKKIEDIIAPKFQLEDCEKLHKSLTLENPLTYLVFLDRRPDLSEEDKEIIHQIIARLKSNDETEYKYWMEKMNDIDSNQTIETEVIIQP